MEHYPRTTRPVGAEAAAGGAPATTQAAQRLGSGVTDGPNFGQNHHRGFLHENRPWIFTKINGGRMPPAERALKSGRILGQIGGATQDPPDLAAPRRAPEPELTARNA